MFPAIDDRPGKLSVFRMENKFGWKLSGRTLPSIVKVKVKVPAWEGLRIV
jgi:hypothetical protein